MLLLYPFLYVTKRNDFILSDSRVQEIHALCHLFTKLLEFGIVRNLSTFYCYIERYQLSSIRVDLVD